MPPLQRKRRTLDLFSGIGGLTLALTPYCQTIAYVDNNESCQAVLRARMASDHIDVAPIITDVCSFGKGTNHRIGTVERVVGGFPCQDISSQGKMMGFEGTTIFFNSFFITFT